MMVSRFSRRLLLCAGIAALLAIPLSGAGAQQAGRAITIVVPYTPGSGPDILGRTIGEELQQRWNQPVVVDNKPGASGNIGTQLAARGAPDGHTILMTTNPFTNNVSLFKNLPYDPVKSFVPIIHVGTGTIALVVHPSVPAKTTRELIDHMKARPGELNYGSPGAGTPHHLAMELFKLVTKTDAKHIPYRGSAGATQDLIGGHVGAAFQAIHVIMPMAAQNQVRLLGVGSKERTPVAPDVPTLQEQGLTDFEVTFWYGILAPAGTPPEIVSRYNATINEILRSPAVVDKLSKQGLIVTGGTPERLATFLTGEIAKWQKVVKDAGIAPAD
jgi:tripartite-type tricarboxylate transporter receptor subunit TctC